MRFMGVVDQRVSVHAEERLMDKRKESAKVGKKAGAWRFRGKAANKDAAASLKGVRILSVRDDPLPPPSPLMPPFHHIPLLEIERMWFV